MGRKTIILREDQFNEICGTNAAYLDNNNDYAEDGTVTTKAAGAVSDSNGEKSYSKPVTGKEWGHEMAPETLFAMLFRNGGHGLFGHWGSGLRARELTEEIDGPTNDYLVWDEQVYYEALKIMKKFDFSIGESIDAVEHIIDVYVNSSNPDNKLLNLEPELAAKYVAMEAMRSIDLDYYDSEVRPFFNLQESNRKLTEENAGSKNINLDDMQEPLYDYDLFENGDANYYFSTSEPLANNSSTMEAFFELIKETDHDIMWDYDGSQAFAKRNDGMEIQLDAAGNGDFCNHIVTVTVASGGKIYESNHELEGNTYVMDLGDGKKKRSYTSLTTEKNELEQEIVLLRRNGNLTPEGQAELEKKLDRLYRINMKLGMETKRVKDQKRIKKDIFGSDNAFIKPHTKNSKNGKAHSKKTKDPNVGTGYITYAE